MNEARGSATPRAPWQTLALLAGALALAPTLAGAADAAAGQVWLRVRNSSSVTFEHVWQGHPQRGSDHDFGRLVPRQTSRWHAFPAALPHYRKTRILLDDGRQLVDVTERAFPRGDAVLSPGRYTFDYTLQHGQLELRVIDEGRARPMP